MSKKIIEGNVNLFNNMWPDFARKLERERDKWEQDALRYCKNSDYHREMREKAERERDEARKKLEEEIKWHHRTHKELVEAQCKLLDI